MLQEERRAVLHRSHLDGGVGQHGDSSPLLVRPRHLSRLRGPLPRLPHLHPGGLSRPEGAVEFADNSKTRCPYVGLGTRFVSECVADLPGTETMHTINKGRHGGLAATTQAARRVQRTSSVSMMSLSL